MSNGPLRLLPRPLMPSSALVMTVGVATANSILVVSFARDRLREPGIDAYTAALEAGFARFRPVLMTALAMIIGMVPLALGLGEGGEQNAPLGRAVIGGLSLATVATLAGAAAAAAGVVLLLTPPASPGPSVGVYAGPCAAGITGRF